MQIGLIGGVGPVATEIYYRALVRAYASVGHRLPLTIVNADVREMVANLEAGRAAEQAAIFATYVDQLKAGGCDVVAVTSMGGHFCINELEAISSLPIISAIAAMEAYFEARNVARIGVMGTRTVMETGLYGLKAADVVIPPAEEIAEVHDAYVAIAKAGRASAEQCAYFQQLGLRLHRDQGADVIVLGGTDLSAAFANADINYPVVDSALVHAEAIARIGMGGGF